MATKDLDALVSGLFAQGAPIRPVLHIGTKHNASKTPEISDDGAANDSLEWARAVYWAANNLDSQGLTKATAGSTLRYELVRYAKKNMKDFIGQMLPKAMVIKDRADAKGGDADIVAVEERKGISELQRILRAAVREATGEVDE
jgi:hypothetical protein